MTDDERREIEHAMPSWMRLRVPERFRRQIMASDEMVLRAACKIVAVRDFELRREGQA